MYIPGPVSPLVSILIAVDACLNLIPESSRIDGIMLMIQANYLLNKAANDTSEDYEFAQSFMRELSQRLKVFENSTGLVNIDLVKEAHSG